MSIDELVADLAVAIKTFPIPLEPAFVFAFILGGVSNFLKSLDLKISATFRLNSIESVTLIARDTKSTEISK